jgi:hypothetical protein
MEKMRSSGSGGLISTPISGVNALVRSNHFSITLNQGARV